MEMTKFEALLDSLSKRPAMYVGQCCVRSVSHYLDGYCHALNDVGQTETPLDGWMQWVEFRFHISHPAWHWTRILLHVYGSDRAAIEALPRLHNDFLAQRSVMGVQGIEQQLEQLLIVNYGTSAHEPAETTTSPWRE